MSRSQWHSHTRAVNSGPNRRHTSAAGDAAATSVIGDLFSAHPGLLKIYRGSASYADMPVDAQATSAVPHYEVTLEPGATVTVEAVRTSRAS